MQDKHLKFDLIMMDIDMPVMNGIETTIKLRNLDCNSLIIAQTAYANINPSFIYLFDLILEKPI